MTSPLHCSYDNSGNLVQPQLNQPLAAPQIIGITGGGTRIVRLESTISLAVAVADADGVTFQWQFNGADLTNQVSPTLTLTNVTADGKYTVTVTNSLGSASATVSVFVDSTGDLLPDSWQMAHFGNLTSQRAAGDPDQDGIDNLDEFLDGTDPNSSDQNSTTSQRPRLIAYSDVGGVVTVDPVKLSYSLNETVTLTATAFAGYTFAGWDRDLGGAANPAQLMMIGHPDISDNLPLQSASKRVRAKMQKQ
jgi:hypothetical protein